MKNGAHPSVSSGDPLRSRRQLRMLRHIGASAAMEDHLQVTRATTLAELREAYQLVYSVYTDTGFISSDDCLMRLRVFEATPEMATFVSKMNGRIVGVLSVIGDSPDLGLPSDTAFRTELGRFRAQQKRLCEVTNQVVSPEFRNSSAMAKLIQCAMAHGIHSGFDQGVAAISKSHQPFYEALSFFEAGGLRSYSSLIHDPVVAVSVDISVFRNGAKEADEVTRLRHAFFAEENPFMAEALPWAHRATPAFLKTDLLKALFVDETNFLAHRSRSELRALRSRWGREMYLAVARQPWSLWMQQAFTALLCRLDMLKLPQLSSKTSPQMGASV